MEKNLLNQLAEKLSDELEQAGGKIYFINFKPLLMILIEDCLQIKTTSNSLYKKISDELKKNYSTNFLFNGRGQYGNVTLIKKYEYKYEYFNPINSSKEETITPLSAKSKKEQKKEERKEEKKKKKEQKKEERKIKLTLLEKMMLTNKKNKNEKIVKIVSYQEKSIKVVFLSYEEDRITSLYESLIKYNIFPSVGNTEEGYYALMFKMSSFSLTGRTFCNKI